jgi:MOSC domain-containing protein YiiM
MATANAMFLLVRPVDRLPSYHAVNLFLTEITLGAFRYTIIPLDREYVFPCGGWMNTGGGDSLRIVSVNVGLPRKVVWKGKIVTTGIFKNPVDGRVRMRTLNLDGDGQADLTVHGGPSKALYAYPSEHYAYWRGELPGMDLPWGMFGENLTTYGLLESHVRIGDRFRIGSAEVVVTEPRMPCYKLGLKFGRDDIIKRFLASRRTGFYLAVLREGEVGAGETIQPVSQDPLGVTVADIAQLYASKRGDVELLRRAILVEALPESWRIYFKAKIRKAR